MSKGKNQHVVPHPNGGWQVKGEGNKRATARTSTQNDAIKIARGITKIKNPSWLFIVPMVKSEIRIRMVTIHSRRKDNNCVPSYCK